jgi:plasmid stabilization system protein ParE
MTRRVVYTDDAAKQAASAVDWYSAQRPGLGARFEQRLDECSDLIGQNPYLARERAPGLRFRVTAKFQYKVWYTIGPAGLVTIVAITHQRQRDPALVSGSAP